MSYPRNLDELFELMVDANDEAWADAGLPTAHGDPDWTELPVFGGDAPDDTREIWSWDETRMIVGTHADDLEIMERNR